MSPEDKEKSIDEQVKALLQEYSEKEKSSSFAKTKEKEKLLIKEKKTQCIRRVFAVIAVSAILYLYIFEPFFIKPSPDVLLWFPGTTGERDAPIQECIETLWNIRRAVNRYYSKNRNFPDNLESLVSSGMLGEFPRCSESGKRYIFEKISGRLIVSCPDASRHGVKRVWMDFTHGPPRVERL